MFLDNLLNEQQDIPFSIEEHRKFTILESEIDFSDLLVTEESDILSKKNEILEKLKKSRSPKERTKLLTKLKNLNKTKRIKEN